MITRRQALLQSLHILLPHINFLIIIMSQLTLDLAANSLLRYHLVQSISNWLIFYRLTESLTEDKALWYSIVLNQRSSDRNGRKCLGTTGRILENSLSAVPSRSLNLPQASANLNKPHTQIRVINFGLASQIHDVSYNRCCTCTVETTGTAGKSRCV